MKHNYYKTRKNGETCVISCTTRKANYTDYYYGKFTYWPTKEAYTNGDCEGTITFKNIFLGNIESDLDLWGNKTVDGILKNIEKEPNP